MQPPFLLLTISLAAATGFGANAWLNRSKNHSPPIQSSPSIDLLKNEQPALVRRLLEEDLGTRRFSFQDVIHSSTGKTIIPFDPQSLTHQQIRAGLDTATQKVMSQFNQLPSPLSHLRRINEASRYFEDALKLQINALPEFSCEIPINPQGKLQRSGYPDLLITHLPSQTKIYLDPKLYEKRSENSSLRTFYYEPRTKTLKVQHDALHLLLGIKHDGKHQNWKFLSAKIVDLSKIEVRLKAEFQASNKVLYRSINVIATP